jgi:peptidoglycan hydrolase CwlO-like protein
MSFIVTDVERVLGHSAPLPTRSISVLQRVAVPALAVVTVLSCTVLGLARPAAGDAISSAKAKAAAIESQLSQAQDEMSALSQQYDEAKYHLSQIDSSIATTQANIANDQKQVAKDKATLSKAAVANYISNGSAAAQNPIFSGNE